MEPLTALGLVSNVVQLADFTTRVIAETSAFMRSSSDALPSNDTIAKFATESLQLSDRLSAISSNQLTLEELTVKQLAKDCAQEAESLLRLLNSFKVPVKPNGRKSWTKAALQTFRTKRKRDVIKTARNKLAQAQGQESTALLQLIRYVCRWRFRCLHKTLPCPSLYF